MRVGFLVCLALVGPGGTARAQSTATHPIVIHFRHVAELGGRQPSELLLTEASPAVSGARLTARAQEPEGLRLSHRLPTDRQVTAEAIVLGDRTDVDLHCTVATAGAGTMLVRQGVSQGARPVVGGIASGEHRLGVRWQAQATAAGTSKARHECLVRFTMMDQ